MSASMEVRVKCGCGSVLSFNEEPVNGRVRWPIRCTSCGADATDQANAFIARRQQPETGLRQTPPKRRPWWGRRNHGIPTPVESASFGSDSLGVESAAGSGAPAGRMALGILVCLAAGGVSMLGWYSLTRWTGYEFGIVAWGIGGLVGVCARYCVPNGSLRLAGIAAACAATAIVGGAVLTLRHESIQLIDELLPDAYQDARDYAVSALKLDTDEEIREFITEHRIARSDAAVANPIEAAQERQLRWMDWTLHGIVPSDPDPMPGLPGLAGRVDPESISLADVAAFREKEVPALRAFIDGQPSSDEFQASLRRKFLGGISQKDLIIESVGPYTVLWLFLGIGTAFKLAHNRGLEY